MIDPALAYCYFGLPATIGPIGLAAMRLHERSAPPMAKTDKPEVAGVWPARDGVRVSIVLDGLSETVSGRDLQRAIEAATRRNSRIPKQHWLPAVLDGRVSSG